MIRVSHRLAGIKFCTESDEQVPRLHEEPFDPFSAAGDGPPDVWLRLHRVRSDSILPRHLAEKEQVHLSRLAHVEPLALENPLLRAPSVQDWLREGLSRPTPIDVWLHPNRIIGYDFDRRVLDFFYGDDFGQPSNGVEEVEKDPPIDDEGNPLPQLRIRQVDFDPRTAPPLPAEERQRLAQGVAFWLPETLDLPLLRAAEIRSELHAALDRGERVESSIHQDGMFVWNFDRQTLDFFYYLEYGNSPEGRVTVHLPRMVSAFLPAFSALLVHSSGVIRDGRAALFLAPDEGGKTTVLRRADGGMLLNDDQIILRKKGSEFIAHATPFGRLRSGDCQAALGGLFVLEKARTFALEPLQPAELVRQLWEEHTIYTAILPRALKMRAFDLFYEACHRVPTYRMRFPIDFVDWAAIDAAMS